MQSDHFGGRWTEEKLDCLTKYLRAYTTIFDRNARARFFTTYYVDAFAGTGRVTLEGDSQTLWFREFAEPDTQGYLKGSATRALEVEPGFKQYLFIERDPARCRELEKLKLQFPRKAASIQIKNEEADRYLKRWCHQTDWSRVRAVVFLDPFGMQVSWSLLTQIAETKGIDLWLLFPLGIGVSRLLTKKAPPPPAWADRVTDILGTEEWKGVFYQKKTVTTLFGKQELEEKEADYDSVGSFFLNRLSTIFEGVARRPLVLRNSRNTPLYLFCFAAGNKRGASTAVRIAESIIGEN